MILSQFLSSDGERRERRIGPFRHIRCFPFRPVFTVQRIVKSCFGRRIFRLGRFDVVSGESGLGLDMERSGLSKQGAGHVVGTVEMHVHIHYVFPFGRSEIITGEHLVLVGRSTFLFGLDSHIRAEIGSRRTERSPGQYIEIRRRRYGKAGVGGSEALLHLLIVRSKDIELRYGICGHLLMRRKSIAGGCQLVVVLLVGNIGLFGPGNLFQTVDGRIVHILVAAVLGIVGPQEKIESTAGKKRDVEKGRLVCVRLLYDPFVEFGLIAACPDFEDIPQVVSLYVRYLFGYGSRLRGRRQPRSE